MWREVSVVATAFVACTRAQGPSAARTPAPPAPSDTAVAMTVAPRVQAPASAQPPSESPPDDATVDARRAEELEWAMARFPAIAHYTSADELWTMQAALLDWAKPGQSVTLFDRACRPVRVTRHDDELWGILSRDVRRTGRKIQESFEEIAIGVRLHEFATSTVEYERDGAGRWVTTGSQGFGGFRSVGFALSRVTEDAAWYAGAAIRLSVDCTSFVSEETACSDGKVRVCKRCDDWKIVAHSLELRFGMHRTPTVRRVTLPPTNGCDVPCAVDDLPPDVKRANQALRGHEFLYTIDADAHPLVFRTLAACRAYRKVHVFEPDELEVWSAGKPRPADLPELRFEDE